MPTYGTLRWEGLVPGLTLAFGRMGAGLSLTVESATDTTLALLRLRIEGADGVRVDAEGRLVADTAIGPVPLPPLLTTDGTPLEPSRDGEAFAFRAPSRPFVPVAIQAPADDPSDLLYSTFLGGSDYEYSYDIALGPDGSMYVTGWTLSTDFPTTPGAFDTTCGTDGECNPNFGQPQSDVFVSRLSPDGNTLLYSTYLGGHSQDANFGGIAVGADGAVYVTGYTWSSDFPTTPGAYDATCGTDGLCNYDGTRYYSDAFITKMAADGSALLYGTYLGGASFDSGVGLALGPDGTVYIAGGTQSSDFPTTPEAFDTSQNGGQDVFVTRLSPDLVRMYVADITPFYRPQGSRYLVGARIAIQDANSAPVSNAAVTVNIDLPSGSQLTFTNTTNTTGRVIFRQLVRDTGTYTFTVTTVSKYGWLYDASLNVETSDSISIP